MEAVYRTDNCFFFDQKRDRNEIKRQRKRPEDLPKVAALLLLKEGERLQELDPDPDPNLQRDTPERLEESVTGIQSSRVFEQRSHPGPSPAQDPQRWLFNQFKQQAPVILTQLAQALTGPKRNLPRSLEQQLTQKHSDLTHGVKFQHREWQCPGSEEEHRRTVLARERELLKAKAGSLTPRGSSAVSFGAEKKKVPAQDDGIPDVRKSLERTSRNQLVPEPRGENETSAPQTLDRATSVMKRLSSSSASKILRDKSRSAVRLDPSSGGRCSTRLSTRRSRMDEEFSTGGSRFRADRMKEVVVQFQLSSKVCDEKGWIMRPGAPENQEDSALIEWVVDRLRHETKARQREADTDRETGNDQQCVVRHYGDKKQVHSSHPPVSVLVENLKAGNFEMPGATERNDPKKLLFTTTVTDGSTVVYYPSGRPAVVTSRSGSLRGDVFRVAPGRRFYTLAFSDAPGAEMLAAFTPSGTGCCYRDGVIRLLATKDGVTLVDQNGRVMKRLDWSLSDATVSPPLTLKLNKNLTYECVKGQNTLMFNCNRESAVFHLVATTEEQPKQDKKLGKLASGLEFTSRAAQESLKPEKPRTPRPDRTTKGKAKPKGKSPSLEDRDSAQSLRKEGKSPHVLDVSVKEPETPDVALEQIQTQIRDTVERWLEHYRSAVGLRLRLRATRDAAQTSPADGAPVLDETEDRTEGDCQAANARANPTSLSPSRGFFAARSRTAEKTPRVKSAPHLVSVWPAPPASSRLPRNGCPLSLRSAILGGRAPSCKCSSIRTPFLSDVELDEFIARHVPDKQLLIVAVVSTPGETSAALELLERMHAERNRARARPCAQAHRDAVRVLQYDVTSASADCAHVTPLLVRRHNVVSGMFLMYQGGELVFCDHIFDGHGMDLRDLQQQLMLTRRTASQGYSLPRDFRFSPQRGRTGPRAAWGGEIGGAVGMERGWRPATEPRRGVPDASDGAAIESVSSLGSLGADTPLSVKLGQHVDSAVRYISSSLSGYHANLLPTASGGDAGGTRRSIDRAERQHAARNSPKQSTALPTIHSPPLLTAPN